jgi:hypothetical protein
MFTRRFVLSVVAVAGIAVVGAASLYARAPLTRVNHLTFSKAVRLPGALLTPGTTYTFEAGPLGTNMDIVRVTTRDGQRVLYQGFTIPVSRPARGPMVSLGEAPVGAPQPISVWYEDGSTTGHRFRYE